MGLFSQRTPVTATVHDTPLECVICKGTLFWDREIKLNTSGMELLDLGWANQSALGLVCAVCGYVHEFVGDAVQMWKAE